MMLALFRDNSPETLRECLWQNHACKPRVGIAGGDQCREIAFGLGKRHRAVAPGRLPGARLVDEVPQLLRKGTMAKPRLMRSDLHRHGQKLLVVAVDMAAQQGYKVLRRGHLLHSGAAGCVMRVSWRFHAMTRVGRVPSLYIKTTPPTTPP
jgi:hypothetical protein